MKSQRQPGTVQNSKIPWWLIGLVAAGVILIAVVLIGGNANSTPTNYVPEVKGAPAVKVDKEKVDLGNVKLGQTVSVSFDVTNVGDQPLRFKEKPYVEVVEGC
jgi:hypothetical protein